MIMISVFISIYVEPTYSHVLTVLLFQSFTDFKIMCMDYASLGYSLDILKLFC